MGEHPDKGGALFRARKALIASAPGIAHSLRVWVTPPQAPFNHDSGSGIPGIKPHEQSFTGIHRPEAKTILRNVGSMALKVSRSTNHCRREIR